MARNKRMSLHRRLIMYFLVFVIGPILAVGISLYFVAYNSAEKNAIKFSNQIINRLTTEIGDILMDSYNVSLLISEEPYIQENLRKPLNEDLPTRFSIDLAIDSRLNYIGAYNSNLFGLYLIAENGGKYKSNYTTVREEDMRSADWYRQIIDSEEPVWFGTHYESFATMTSGKSMISLGFPVEDKATGDNMGALIVDIEESMLSDMINREIGSEGVIFVLDENNEVVSHPNRELINTVIDIDEQNAEALPEFGSRYYINDSSGEQNIWVYKQLPMNEWKVVASMPISGLTEDIEAITDVMFVGLFLTILLVMVAAWNISDSIVNPIRKMMELMKRVESGDLNVVMSVEKDDEIGDLSRSFNRMIVKVKDLMDTVMREQKEMRKAELIALQSQINPHFLYNTLSTIIWMAREKENDKIVRIVTAITRFYRIGISRGRDIISIEDEVEHIRNYLIILYQRYSDKFDYEINIPMDLYRYKTLKLVLQPIVENAIYHGVKGKRDKGHIFIMGNEKEEEIVFTVIDTGVGMNEEQLASLTTAINDFSGEHVQSYGLRNVNERIKIFFGQQYGITIDSEEGRGTTVQVKIPKKLEV